jgi:hypothetical protein
MGRLRIDEFYNKISVCTSDEELISICNLEKEYITNSYNTLESRKASFTIYRNGFANHYLKNNYVNYNDIFKAIVEITKNKSMGINILLQTAAKYHVSIIDFKHLIKKYDAVRSLKLTKDETNTININYKAKVWEEQKIRKLIKNPQGLIDKAIFLLSSKSYINRVLALAALTGRRVAEIGCTAEFTPFSENVVVFKGQLKTKGKECEDYKIPLLSTTKLIITCLKEMRLDMPQYINNPATFHSNCSKELSLRVKKHFSEFVEGDITAKDLRAIYITIVCDKYKPKRMSEQCYYSQILGHSEADLNTCNSYFDFLL